MGWVNVVLSWLFMIGMLIRTLLFSSASFSTVLEGPVISTMVGSFEGRRVTPLGQEHAVYAFLGIPYAQPPIGNMRFSKPNPITLISDVFKATNKPPSCFQNSQALRLPWADKNSTMSEDCLYLNIWTPERSVMEGKLKPVMFWIHGGGLISGSSAMDIYDGQMMSVLGDVVVVTHNYRLGAFGFLNSLSDDAPGNVGLRDQLLALKWINNNIENFGGDPKQVTLFGESAGARSVAYLAFSPLSTGLFQRIILQSGSSYNPFTRKQSDSTTTGSQLARFFGCANDTISLSAHQEEVVTCLRNVPAVDLTRTDYEEDKSFKKRINKFWPQFFDDVLPKHPIDIFLSKEYIAYDILIGVTKNEGTSLFVHAFPEVYQQYAEGKLTIDKSRASEILESFFTSMQLSHSETIVQYYLKDVGDDQEGALKAICEGIGDFFVTCPVTYLAEKYWESGSKIHFYRFDHRPSTSPWPKWMGVAHFEEVQFVFGMPIRYSEKYEEREKRLSEYVIRTWTNFAKSEDLKLKNGSPWPLYSRSNPVYATFDTGEQKTGTGERKEACEFWRPYFDAE